MGCYAQVVDWFWAENFSLFLGELHAIFKQNKGWILTQIIQICWRKKSVATYTYSCASLLQFGNLLCACFTDFLELLDSNFKTENCCWDFKYNGYFSTRKYILKPLVTRQQQEQHTQNTTAVLHEKDQKNKKLEPTSFTRKQASLFLSEDTRDSLFTIYKIVSSLLQQHHTILKPTEDHKLQLLFVFRVI